MPVENPPAPVNAVLPNAGGGAAPDQAKIDALTDKSGPKAGDFVKVGDKLYTAKEIEALEAARTKAEGDVRDRDGKLATWKTRAAKVYGQDVDQPDRQAVKDFLMEAGYSSDAADAKIKEELGDPEGDAAKDKGKKPEGAEPPKPTREGRLAAAVLDDRFQEEIQKTFTGTPELIKTVEAAKNLFDKDDEKALAEETRRNEVHGDLRIRTERILQNRVKQEGQEAFFAAPIAWFKEALKQAAKETVQSMRVRYGDPNRIGVSPTATISPADAWLKEHTDAGKLKPRDEKTSLGDRTKEVENALHYALISMAKSGTSQGAGGRL